MTTPATSQLMIREERVHLEPSFMIMNRLPIRSYHDEAVFIHKRVEYEGFLQLVGTTPTLVRICIVQPRAGGEQELGHQPTAQQVFGTRDPSIATPIDETKWLRLSDRHYFVTGEQTRYGKNGLWVEYTHRLSHNLSLQSPTLSGYGRVHECPIFFCVFSDVDFADQHVKLYNMFLRTVGLADSVVTTEPEMDA
jgi:hypothetical protein